MHVQIQDEKVGSQREGDSFLSCTCAFELLLWFLPFLCALRVLYKPVQHTSPHPAHVLQKHPTPFSGIKSIILPGFGFILFPGPF